MNTMAKFIVTALLSMVSLLSVRAQDVTIKGHVSAADDGGPLAGAALIAVGGGYSITDNEGNFSMTVSPDEAVTVSYLGYDDYTFTPGNTATFNIVLERSAATMLDETVVIGYGKTTKKEVTGSVTSLKSTDFDLGSFTDATAMLQGKVAGLTITNPDGGDPNGSYEILLRGTNTLMAGQGPLIIIDGVVDADIRNINFQEVESIDVLKDGSAAAIYGTRGTNGVIIITTKRAKAGQMTVEYDGQVSVQTVARRAVPMTAGQFEYTVENFAPASSGSLYGSDTDWFREITRTPISHKHNLAVSGGSENFSHRTILNIEQNQGLQRKNDSDKYLIKTNIHQNAIKGWLTMDYNLSYVKRQYSSANYDAFRQAFLHNPTEPVYDPENKESGGYYRVIGMDYYNPVAMVDERNDENDSDNLTASVRATLNILPVEGLKWDNFFSYNNERYEGRTYRTQYYPSIIGQNGNAYISNSHSSDLQWESTMQYANTFGKHSVQAVLGYTWQQINYRDSSMENYGFDNDIFQTDNIGTGSALAQGMASMSSFRESSRYIAFFGRVMYNYDEKYLASVSLRRDGSTKFGKDNKWGWFPAVSLGWRLNRENWLKDAEWLDELKLRAGYGVTGNQDFSNYKSLLLMEPDGYFYYNGEWVNAYAPSSNANPDLGWEKKTEYNAGLDFAFFDNRLGGSIDYYYRLTTDLLYDYSVPVPPYDYETLFTNVGSISNSGIEITLYGTPVKGEKFEWNTTLTFAKNTNKLISFTNEEFQNGEYKIGWINTPVGVYCQRLIEGESLGSFYGPEWAGVDPDTGNDELEGSIAGTVPEDDWVNLGSAYPDFTLGWSNSLRWGNFGLSATFRAQIGGKVFNNYRAEFENITGIGLKNIMASWLDDTTFTGPVTYSSKYLEDASFLKLDNVSLSYNIRFRNAYLKNIRVYLSAQNVFCLTGYKGVDPEVSLSGLNPGIESTTYYPRTRTFTLGATFTF